VLSKCEGAEPRVKERWTVMARCTDLVLCARIRPRTEARCVSTRPRGLNSISSERWAVCQSATAKFEASQCRKAEAA
jgi:hypothetical protein